MKFTNISNLTQQIQALFSIYKSLVIIKTGLREKVAWLQKLRDNSELYVIMHALLLNNKWSKEHKLRAEHTENVPNFFSHEIILFSHHFPFLPLCLFVWKPNTFIEVYQSGRGKGEGKLDWKSLIYVIFINKYLWLQHYSPHKPSRN